MDIEPTAAHSQSHLNASATSIKPLLAKNAALTTTRQEPRYARLLAAAPCGSQCSQRLFFCSTVSRCGAPSICDGPSARLRRAYRLHAPCGAQSVTSVPLVPPSPVLLLCSRRFGRTLSHASHPPRREISPCSRKIRAACGRHLFFRSAGLISLLPGVRAHSQSRLERHPLTPRCSLLAKNPHRLRAAPVFSSARVATRLRMDKDALLRLQPALPHTDVHHQRRLKLGRRLHLSLE